MIYWFTVLFAGIAFGTLSLILTFQMPTERVIQNVRRSVYTLYSEGVYPSLYTWCSSQLDNWTDSLMLSIIAYNGSETATTKAMNAYYFRYNDENPYSSFIVIFSMPEDGGIIVADPNPMTYTRYWHGYALILKGLFTFFDYATIRLMNLVLQTIVSILVMILFGFRKLRHAILPYFISIGFLMPVVTGFSFQYSAVFYINTFACLCILMRPHFSKDVPVPMFTFLLISMATSFFDLLTYPLATLGIPLVVFLLQNESFDAKEKLQSIFGNSLLWGFGYLGMWAGKWAIASLLLHENIFSNALAAMQINTSTNSKNVFSFYCEALKMNLGYFAFTPVTIIAFLFVIVYVIIMVRRHAFSRTHLPLLLITCMPFAWYFLTSNHVYIHYWFTNRALVVSIFSGLCFLSAPCVKIRYDHVNLHDKG